MTIKKLTGGVASLVGHARSRGVFLLVSVLLVIAVLAFRSLSPEPVLQSPTAGMSAPARTVASAPVLAVADVAERVFYMGEGSREWGTMCRLPGGGFVSVDHVTTNGIPHTGPKDVVTASNALSDWSFIGVDPATLNADDFPELTPGMTLTVAGFPAADRDGELFPGRVYLDDPEWPYVWVELVHRADGSHPEGVVGGVSGSCSVIFTEKGTSPVAVTSANGFSVIAGTTNTWAKVVPIRRAILEAQGQRPAPALSLAADNRPRPAIHSGRHALKD